MMIEPDSLDSGGSDALKNPWNRRIAVITVLTTFTALAAALWLVLGSGVAVPKKFKIAYPVGTPNLSSPSRIGPPSATAMRGYTLDYVTEFPGSFVPSGWNVFEGIPGGDPGGQFAATHVIVSDGLLHLNTWKDPKYHNKWVTGGLCQCGVGRTYRAYFVRSRVTGVGPNEVQLLWPISDVWPPEVDFNETGANVDSTSSTVHFGKSNQIDQQTLAIDLRKWHTWGVVWTPSSIIYVVDGKAWSAVTTAAEIPHVPMRIDLEQRTMCHIKRQCPTKPVSMLVDWIAEYAPK